MSEETSSFSTSDQQTQHEDSDHKSETDANSSDNNPNNHDEDNPNHDPEENYDEENYDEENYDEENWDWGEDTSEGSSSFEAEFEGDFESIFEMYNTHSNHTLCSNEGVLLNISSNILTAETPCTTPNGHQLHIQFEGEFVDIESYSDEHYAYAQSHGNVFVHVPSGDVFESVFYGESHLEGGYVWNYLHFEIEIITPNGSRYYFGSLYTY